MLDSRAAIRPSADPTEIRARFFRALGDPTRLKILELLEAGEATVGEIVNRLQAPQGRVSTHLACLRWCGFVEARREGKFVFYRLADHRVRQMILLADAMVGEHATAIATCTRLSAEAKVQV